MSLEEEAISGPMKRAHVGGPKVLPSAEKDGAHGSKIFAPLRTVGMVADGLPHSLFYLGGVPYVATGLRHSFQILDVESLNVAFISSHLDSQLVSLVSYREQSLTFCEDGSLNLLDRAKLRVKIQLGPDPATFVTMQLFGEQLVVLYERSLILVEIPSLTLQWSMPLDVPEEDKATCLCHPNSYTNKVLVTFSNGGMHLINIRSKKLVYEFKGCQFDASPACIAASPVVDIVAVGLQDGSVWICDVKKDLKLFCLGQNASSEARTISFRSDLHECDQVVIGHADGRLVLWDLDKRAILDYWKAHEPSSHIFATFVQGQPLIISTSGDNSIKQWIIEEGRARLLKFRSGHLAPPTSLQFYGDNGDAILSAALDRALRITVLVKDSQSMELSQGHISSISRRSELSPSELKSEPVAAFGVFAAKELKWDNLVSIHKDSPVARTWRVDHRKLGKHEFRSLDGSTFTSVCISPCGNYALLGCSSGAIDIFNLQSGQHRRHIAFPHSGSDKIVGLGIDPSGTYVVASYDSGRLHCYEFHDGKTRFMHEFTDRIARSYFYADGEILAISHHSDFSITLFDVESRQVVRHFRGHEGPITDILISNNGKWLVSSSQDGTIRTWDIATSLLIDKLALPDIPTAIALSPTQAHLAVTLKNEVAIYLWTNLSLYRPVALPTSVLSSTQPMKYLAGEEQLNKELLTLSLEPRNKFLDIFHIEEVSARSRPQLPLENSSKKTPFFLDSLLAKRSAVGGEIAENKPMENSVPKNDSHFGTLVLSSKKKDWISIFPLLQAMSPSQATFEISTLVASGDNRGLLNCLKSLEHQLHEGSSWELVVALLDKLVTCHAAFMRKQPREFGGIINRIRHAFEKKTHELETQFHSSILLCAFAREH